jgi:hypothetical protein
MKGARLFALAFAAATLSAPAARSATFGELSDRARDSQSSPPVAYPAGPYAASPSGAPSYLFGYGYSAGPYAPTPTYNGLKAPSGGPEGALPKTPTPAFGGGGWGSQDQEREPYTASPSTAGPYAAGPNGAASQYGFRGVGYGAGPTAQTPAFSGGGWSSQDQGRGPYSAGPSTAGPYAVGPNDAASQYGYGGAGYGAAPYAQNPAFSGGGWGSQDQGRGPYSAGPSTAGPYPVGPNGAASQYGYGAAPYAPNPAFGGGAPRISGGPEGVLPAVLGGPAAATAPMPLIRPRPQTNHFVDFGRDPYRPDVPLRSETFGQVNSMTDPYNPWGLSTPFMFVPWSTPLSGWTNAQTWNWWRERSGAPPPGW